MTDVRLNPEAQQQLLSFLDEQRKKTRRGFWGAVGAFALANLAFVTLWVGRALESIEDKAVNAALEQMQAQAESIGQATREAYAMANEQIRQNWSSITRSFNDAYIEIGKVQSRNQDLEGELAEAAGEFEAVLVKSRVTAQEVEQQNEAIRAELVQLRDELTSKTAALFTELEQRQQRLAELAGRIDELQSLATGLEGETAREHLLTLRSLAESLRSGDPLDQLIQLRARIDAVSETVASGRFGAVTCSSLKVLGAAAAPAVELAAETDGGAVSVFNRNGAKIASLSTGPDRNGNLMTYHENGSLLTRLGSNEKSVGGFWMYYSDGTRRLAASANPEGGAFNVYRQDETPALRLLVDAESRGAVLEE